MRDQPEILSDNAEVLEWLVRLIHSVTSNRPFPSSPGPLYHNEVKCSAFDMEIVFHSHANKTHFCKKDCALGLILKVRVFGNSEVANSIYN